MGERAVGERRGLRRRLRGDADLGLDPTQQRPDLGLAEAAVAAWVAVAAACALIVDYYVVNIFVVGLHSYA